MNPLDFLGDRAGLIVSQISNLAEWESTGVPEETGAYILIAADSNAEFLYPGGKSQVFYIGQAKDLRNRLNEHRQNMNSAIKRRQRLFRPKYEYAAKFGALFACVRCSPDMRPKQLEPKELEDELMARFAMHYRSLPVTNGAGAWKRIRKIIATLIIDNEDPS